MTKAMAVLVAALLLAACGEGPSGTGAEGGILREYDFTAFEEEVEAWMAELPGIEGVGAIIVDREDGVVYERGFGTFAPDRIYLVASSSKMVSAGVLMNLEDRGLLDMNEPIVDLLGWGEHNPEITPAQLVSNSSGLVGLDPNFTPYLCQYVWGGTLQECGRTIFTTPDDDDLVIPPDTAFRYGGGQWQLAGAVAEVASGQSWAELIDEIYIEPCGLEGFGFNNHFIQFLNAENPFAYPVGFDSDLSRLLPTENPNMEAGLYTTTAAYGELLLMHLRGGMCGDNRVLSEAAVETMHANRIAEVYGGVAGADGRGYGLGWWVDGGNELLIFDPGAYGSFPWLDKELGYGGFLVIEATAGLGGELFARTYELINEAIEEAHAGD